MFDFGFGSDLFPTFFGPPAVANGTGGAVATAPTNSGGVVGVIQTLSNLAFPWYTATLNNDLASQQVNHGQVPTQNATGNLLSNGGAAGFGGTLLVLIVVVLIFKAIFR